MSNIFIPFYAAFIRKLDVHEIFIVKNNIFIIRQLMGSLFSEKGKKHYITRILLPFAMVFATLP